MDPPGMMSEEPFNLAEIWQFPPNGNGRGQFGQSLAHFADTSRDNDPPPNLEHRGGGGFIRKRRDLEEAVSTSIGSGNGLNDSDGKRIKTRGGSRDGNCDFKPEETELSSGMPPGEQKAQQPASAEPPKQDYIHVRARRGQATDSHSLAERARREKISERMKILQDIVPGCNKVIGKALVLDEIINYIQSLQRQVEFLSMKLEAVNSRMTPGVDVYPSKEYGQQTFDASGIGYGSQTTREYSRGASPEWLHMQIGGRFERS